MPDVSIGGGGTIFLFTLNTPEAQEWVEQNVQLEDYQWTGSDSFAVEHRYAKALAAGMSEAGLAVE